MEVDTIMKKWNSYIKNEKVCFVITTPILLILFILWIAVLWSKVGIDLPGSKDTWIALLGSVGAGWMTMVGVGWTLSYQQKTDLENKRKENLPLIAFSCLKGTDAKIERLENCGIVAMDRMSLSTTNYLPEEKQLFPYLKIYLIGQNPAFNLRPDDWIIFDGFGVREKTAFFPREYRLAQNRDYMTVVLNYLDYDEAIRSGATRNIFFFLSFYYEDLYQNRYTQDLFCIINKDKNGSLQINVERILQPHYWEQDEEIPMLAERIKSYDEYECYKLQI